MSRIRNLVSGKREITLRSIYNSSRTRSARRPDFFEVERKGKKGRSERTRAERRISVRSSRRDLVRLGTIISSTKGKARYTHTPLHVSTTCYVLYPVRMVHGEFFVRTSWPTQCLPVRGTILIGSGALKRRFLSPRSFIRTKNRPYRSEN